MRLCKESQKLLVDHWLKLQIVETNRLLWNCMNRHACEREQKKAMLSMFDDVDKNRKDTFVPSPGSLRPPEYPQGVAIPAGVGGPIAAPVPVPVPAPVPVGGRVGGVHGRRVIGGVPLPGGHGVPGVPAAVRPGRGPVAPHGQQQGGGQVPQGGQQQEAGRVQQGGFHYYGIPPNRPQDPNVSEIRQIQKEDGYTYESRWATPADTGGAGYWVLNGPRWNTLAAQQHAAQQQQARQPARQPARPPARQLHGTGQQRLTAVVPAWQPSQRTTPPLNIMPAPANVHDERVRPQSLTDAQYRYTYHWLTPRTVQAQTGRAGNGEWVLNTRARHARRRSGQTTTLDSMFGQSR